MTRAAILCPHRPLLIFLLVRTSTDYRPLSNLLYDPALVHPSLYPRFIPTETQPRPFYTSCLTCLASLTLFLSRCQR
ncbi:hypothetical protein PISMIDRAFT_537946 [Pisolithus microcarpus 441]|uniref:Uncharacterized protein n=1 Tax=Pisolithus microcarpus 441 TaxID=765257 RepID=A0A0C9Z6A3_9AGAM|nr:hypothetical protein BKA83DRAFT_537946 [Pisolithus microcarpus]KIK21634.1 hypothetical protein PISMIDRAFT_537946 [Pisolithus microcarpus 441]